MPRISSRISTSFSRKACGSRAGSFMMARSCPAFSRASARKVSSRRGVDVHDFLEHFAQARIRRIDDAGRVELGLGGLRLRGFLRDVRRGDGGRELSFFFAQAAHRRGDRIGRGRIGRQRSPASGSLSVLSALGEDEIGAGWCEFGHGGDVAHRSARATTESSLR